MNKHLISMADLNGEEIWEIIQRAIILKKERSSRILDGKSLALLFELPSLRTRVSFDIGMRQMGGHAIYLSPQEVGLGTREPISDVARVLSRYVNGIAARTFKHQTVEELASYASIPVINALSDAEHPCQVLADLLTIYECKKGLKGVNIAFIGDGNNMAASLCIGAMLVGANLTLSSPKGYQLKGDILDTIEKLAAKNGSVFRMSFEPKKAAVNADVIYTDVWTSMGQEDEASKRVEDFSEYRIDSDLLSLADSQAIFMHPLPAHPGEEISDGMLNHPQSLVFPQAENRLHAQKAVLELLLA